MTVANGKSYFSGLTNKESSDILTLQAAYEFLTERLLTQFTDEVASQKQRRTVFFIVLMIVIGFSTLIIQLHTINRLKFVDKVLRRTLKIIPFDIIKDNKVFGFFVIQEFEKELGGIKRHLQ